MDGEMMNDDLLNAVGMTDCLASHFNGWRNYCSEIREML